MANKEVSRIDEILETLSNIRYGSVVITIHDGEITQIDVTEKKRFPVSKKESKPIK